MPALRETGEEGFLAGLERCGCPWRRQDGVILFAVEPVDGCYAGNSIETGVAVKELRAWPSVPPHWVHSPSFVKILRTNTRPSPVSGWLMHSRNVQRWGDAEDPVQAWLAHARAVLGESQ